MGEQLEKGDFKSALDTIGVAVGGDKGATIAGLGDKLDLAKGIAEKLKSGDAKAAIETIAKSVSGGSYDLAKSGFAGLTNGGGLDSARDLIGGADGMLGSVGAKIPIFNKIDEGLNVLEHGGDAIKELSDSFKGGDLADKIDASQGALGAVAGAGVALGAIIGGKNGKRIGKAMGKVSTLAKGGVESVVNGAKTVGKMFSKAASVGAAGVSSLVNAGAVIGKVVGGKFGQVISGISSVVTACMTASPLAIVTGAIEGLKLLGKIIPGKVGQKIGELAAIVGDLGISHIVGGVMESVQYFKKGKVVDGLFHLGKKLNPISFGMSFVDKIGGWIGGDVGKAIQKFAGALTKATEFAFDVAKGAFKALVVAPAKAVLKGLESISNAIFGKKATAAIKKAISGVAKAVWGGVKAVGKAVFDGIKGVAKGVWNGVKGIGKGIVDVGKNIGKGIANVAKSVGRGIKKFFKKW